MASRLLVMNRLPARERLAINLLRGEYPEDLASESKAGFDRLRAMARSSGLAIHGIGNPCAGLDEMRILGWIAALQRRRNLLRLDFDEALGEALLDCAHHFDAMGMRLEYRRAARAMAATGSAEVDPVGQVSTLQGRIARFVREQGAVSASRLSDLGASHRVISRMVRYGLLQRTGDGRYVAPEVAQPSRMM